jgi:hypothetical protein
MDKETTSERVPEDIEIIENYTLKETSPTSVV